jgi:hypothetical protein
MIGITITGEVYAAIAATPPVKTSLQPTRFSTKLGFSPGDRTPDGKYTAWIPSRFSSDRGESHSDAIIRLAKLWRAMGVVEALSTASSASAHGYDCASTSTRKSPAGRARGDKGVWSFT